MKEELGTLFIPDTTLFNFHYHKLTPLTTIYLFSFFPYPTQFLRCLTVALASLGYVDLAGLELAAISLPLLPSY